MEHLFGALGAHRPLAQQPAVGKALGHPRQQLLEAPGHRLLRHPLRFQVAVEAQHPQALGVADLAHRPALDQVIDLPKNPGIHDGRPADHDARRLGGAQAPQGLLRRGDVARTDHRHWDGLGHGVDDAPVGAARVELGAGTAVDGDHLRPGLDAELGHLDRVDRVVAPARADLDRDRDLDRLHHLLDHLGQVIALAHQLSTAAAPHHLGLRRT